jgi:hypothetical protein
VFFNKKKSIRAFEIGLDGQHAPDHIMQLKKPVFVNSNSSIIMRQEHCIIMGIHSFSSQINPKPSLKLFLACVLA